MPDVSNIRIVVTLDGSQVRTGAATTTAAVTTMERRVSDSLNRVRNAFTGLSTGQRAFAGLAVGAGIVGTALAATIRPAIEFESAFAGVLKTVDGTPAQLDGIRDGLLGMSRVMPAAANDLAAIAENAGQLGVAAPDVLQFTETIAQLGETTDLSFEGAAQSLARFLNVTGNDAPIERIADVIVDLGNNSATTESQIVDFSTRLASSLTIAGATESEILSLAASFSSLGLRSEAGGTAVSRIFTVIADAARDGGEALNVLAETSGLTNDQFAQLAINDPTEAFLRFGAGLGEVSAAGGTLTPILDTLGIGGIRTSEVMRLLALNTDQVRASIERGDEAFAEGGAAAEEYGRRVETTAAQLEILRNRITALAIQTGTPFLGALISGANLAGDAIEGLFEILAPLGQEIGTSFALMAQGAAAFFQTIGSPVLSTAVASLSGLSVVLTGILQGINALGPAGIVVAGLIADFALWGPVTANAAVAMGRLSIAVEALGIRGAAASVSMRALNLAVAAGPYIAIAAVLAAVGKALSDADAAGQAAADTFRTQLNDAIDTGNLVRVSNELRTVQNRIESLRELDEVPDSLASGFDGWGASLTSVIQILTPLDNEILNARREADALEAALGDSNMGNYVESLEQAANYLGLTKQETLTLAQELGVLEQLTQGTTADFYDAGDAMAAYLGSLTAAVDGNRELAEALAFGEDGYAAYADSLEITVGQLEELARAADVDLADLIDDDALVSAEAYGTILDGFVVPTLEALGESSVQAAVRVAEVTNSLTDAASAANELQSVISGTNSALESLTIQNSRVADAEQNLIDVLGNGSATIQEQTAAVRELLLQRDGSARSTADLVENERALVEQLRQASEQGLISAETFSILRAEIEGIPDEARFRILVESQAAFDELLAFALELDTIPPSILTELGFVSEQALLDFAYARDEMQVFTEQYGTVDTELTVTDNASDGVEGFTGLLTTIPDRIEVDIDADADDAVADAEEVDTAVRRIPRQTTPRIDIEGADEAADAADAVEQGLRGIPNRVDSEVDVDTEEATVKLEGLTGLLSGYGNRTDTATLDADEEPAVRSADSATGVTLGFANGSYVAVLSAVGELARQVTGQRRDDARNYADGDYNAQLRATDAGSSAQSATVRALARAYADAVYNARLTASDSGSSAQSNRLRGLAQAYAGGYNATLTARDLASSIIRSAVGTLSGFQSRSITLTANYRTTGSVYQSGTYRADGAISGVRQFNDGGLALVPTSSGRAEIYQPVGPGMARVHTEPETGGESYIPLHPNKRARSTQIWVETGRHLGVFNDGGIASQNRVQNLGLGSVMISAPVTVDASGQSDPEQIGQMVAQGVERVLVAVGDDLMNRRI